MRHPYRGLKKDRTLRKALGAFSVHVSKVDVLRGATKGGSRLNHSITPPPHLDQLPVTGQGQ